MDISGRLEAEFGCYPNMLGLLFCSSFGTSDAAPLLLSSFGMLRAQ